VLSIALYDTVYLWNATNGSTSELVTLDDRARLPVSAGPQTAVTLPLVSTRSIEEVGCGLW
jgi:hypothetical protein